LKILLKAPAGSNVDTDQLQKELQAITAYKEHKEMGTHIMLELDSETIVLESIQQLFALFERWEIDKSPLESLLQMVDAHSDS
jgi:hypothetical protein